MVILLGVLAVLFTADIITTLICLSGGFKEGNPIFKWVIDKFGIRVFVISNTITKLVALVILYFLFWWVTLIFILFFVYVIINNLRYIWKK